jgi:hypothetical protein
MLFQLHMLNMTCGFKMIMNGENFTLMAYYAVRSGRFLLTLWVNLNVPSPGSKN